MMADEKVVEWFDKRVGRLQEERNLSLPTILSMTSLFLWASSGVILILILTQDPIPLFASLLYATVMFVVWLEHLVFVRDSRSEMTHALMKRYSLRARQNRENLFLRVLRTFAIYYVFFCVLFTLLVILQSAAGWSLFPPEKIENWFDVQSISTEVIVFAFGLHEIVKCVMPRIPGSKEKMPKNAVLG